MASVNPKRSGPSREQRNIRTVADAANVSIATVSRTVNGVATVDPALAKRVWQAVHELGYVPNTQARGLVSGRSRIFGLIVSDITNPFFPELIQGFEDVAVEHGYEILVSSTNDDPKRMSHCIRRMLERKVEGVAVMTFGIEEPLLEQMAQRVPLVFIDVGPARARASLVKVNYHHGILQGVQHLIALGHTKIAFISGPPGLRSAQSRKSAFSGSLKQCGMRPNLSWIVEGNHTLEGGIAAMERLLARKSRMPTAVMCSNDMTAIGVLHRLYRSGLRVPHDLSVIGFDNIHIAEVTIPPLTTVEMSRLELARAAVTALRQQVESVEEPLAESEVHILTSLVVRESTGSPAQR
ncbi:MAG: LacI family DNA-binding transcriptional regulator [Acidobacteriaceae bacterium]